MVRPVPSLINCVGVTGRWGLLYHAKNVVRWLALSRRLVESRSSSQASSLCVAVLHSKQSQLSRVIFAGIVSSCSCPSFKAIIIVTCYLCVYKRKCVRACAKQLVLSARHSQSGLSLYYLTLFCTCMHMLCSDCYQCREPDSQSGLSSYCLTLFCTCMHVM